MKSIELQMLQTLYEQDFYAWVEQTAELLRSDHWDTLDLEHLIEEVVDLGKKPTTGVAKCVAVGVVAFAEV